ncbi:MAG TPA: DegV family protein [Acidimicrobiia bacterium]|nr:DegV family protein [Acidimicrobiia bacterium]
MAVITDSAATLPPELTSRLAITVVPIRLLVGDQSYRDGDIAQETLLAATKEATTAGPTPADFVAAIEEHPTAEGVVIATLSYQLGASTFLAARTASNLVEIPTRVVDTETAAGGEGLVVLKAARVAAAGGSIDEVEAAARNAAAHVELVATLPNLDHLVRSGHVPQAASWAARWIGLQPVITLRHGKVSPMTPVRSDRAALNKLYETWRRSKPDLSAQLHIAALHSMAEADAKRLLRRVADEWKPRSSFVGTFGSPMLLHTGPGVVGLSWLWENESP